MSRWLGWTALLLLGLGFSACSDRNSNPSADGEATDGDTDGDEETAPSDGDETDGDEESEPSDGDETPERMVDLVNPFIGTGGLGYSVGSGLPGALAPFGLVKVSPDTEKETGAPPFYHCSGYHADDTIIDGFSHVHIYGAGAADLGNIRFMPILGPITPDKTRPMNYRSPFQKTNEYAKPGWYAVTLDATGTTAELTATEHAAHHRYTFSAEPADGRGYLLIDLDEGVPSTRVTDGGIAVDAEARTVEGWVLSSGDFSGRYGGMPIYFAARFNRPFDHWGTWAGSHETLNDGAPVQSGDILGAYLGFDLGDGEPVEAQVGVSYVSIDNARENREAEMPEWDFDGARAATEAAWEDELSVVRFEGGAHDQRVIMATALYHAFIHPDIFSDVNGEYVGFDRQTHTAEGEAYYNTFSLWDTYRTLHPLMTLLKPERTRDMMTSLVKMAEQGGWLPRWPMGLGDSGSMIGTSADVAIADAYVKGVADFDVDTAFAKIEAAASGPAGHYGDRGGIEEYMTLGYVADDKQGGSVAKTMEYGVDDSAIANLARALGETEKADYYAERSKNYRHLWYADEQFFFPRNSDGSWITDLSLDSWEEPYTEGTAWQYIWLAPHDMRGLLGLFGSQESMTAKLTTFFEEGKREAEGGTVFALDAPAYYWHGNEPDIHAAYLFLQGGRPDLTQKWVEWISNALYSTAPDGLAGNDDCGTLSAWYVFSSLGFYPIAGSDVYLVGKPLFPHAEAALAGGTLTVEAPDVSPENIYVQGVTLDGAPLDVPWFFHRDIAQGATLHFDMGPEPSEWGKIGPDQGPPSP
ncbi:MAG: glycoside hydrolase family 92 protein [Myxococcales bacterium]|nr:MAG: glycoside hydrolase family 92 protein [Myxococcales bacterium]